MLKILHTADWQIGRFFSQFDEEGAAALSAERFNVVSRIAELARREEVDLVLVAGDVFDAQSLKDKTVRKLFHHMSAFPGEWVLIPGNHDAALSESIWSRAQRLNAIPPNVRLCLAPEALVLPGKCVVLPAPLVQRHTYTDVTAWYDSSETDAGLPRIGVAHGSVQGLLPDGAGATNPIDPARAESARLDYLALGDWHGTLQINERCWYAGTPETDRFKSNDSGNVLLVSLAGCGVAPEVRVMPTGGHEWVQKDLVLAGPSDAAMVVRELGALPDKCVADIRISGYADLAAYNALKAALAHLEARACATTFQMDGLRLEPTEEDIAALRLDGYAGEVLAVLRGQQEAGGDQAELARDALLVLARMLEEDAPAAARPVQAKAMEVQQ